MLKIRGFEVVDDAHRKHPLANIILPTRSTSYSAGYDIIAPDNLVIYANSSTLFWTDVKAYMQPDEYLKIVMRSSLSIKKGLFLLNQVGIVDHDYYSNEKNDGNIAIAVGNRFDSPVEISKGEKIAQGIFSKYFIADNDETITKRNGGIGSTTE